MRAELVGGPCDGQIVTLGGSVADHDTIVVPRPARVVLLPADPGDTLGSDEPTFERLIYRVALLRAGNGTVCPALMSSGAYRYDYVAARS